MNGKDYKRSIHPQLKLLLLILSSNFLFYLLFFPSQSETSSLPSELVEVKVEAKLFTSFQNGKKVTLYHPQTNKNVLAHLVSPADEEGLVTVASDIDSSIELLSYKNWRIIPPIQLQVMQQRGESREIKY